MRELDTNKANTWCSGCGNFGIINAVKKAIHDLNAKEVGTDDIVITAGIGCHGKIFDYLNLSGIYGLHGRALATAQGIKLANPDLKIISFGGDGDSLGEGLEHTLFAAKRNMDITLILHNNGNYGLTTGQFSPLSFQGYKGLSTPFGSIEKPFDAVPLLIEAGATFVARAYSARIDHLCEMIVKAVQHKGFSFVEVLQPCVAYNNTYQLFNQKVKHLEIVPDKLSQALTLARSTEDIYIGIFHQETRAVYHELLYQDANPYRQRKSAAERREHKA
ncbi:MAG: thiamine pyrophosphate-dependent enzyme [Candidatus Cloacimonadaceae bacterium]|nr:thiamine pyrophosphate-dependent enzyme [Candidatus Cloacimonadaceae bacterium]MDP3114265.1 thiamine pyrophosphate-dependent enzyme [Candidatus Cloacimonadaceae bacterium]